VQLALVEVRVGDVGERERLHLVAGGAGHRHGLERVRIETHAAGGSRRRGGQRHLQEAAAIESAQPPQESVTLLVVLRLDAGVAAHGYLPPLCGPPAARSSNGRTLRMASSLSRNGRCVSERSCCAACWRSFSSFRRSSVMLNSSATIASISLSVS